MPYAVPSEVLANVRSSEAVRARLTNNDACSMSFPRQEWCPPSRLWSVQHVAWRLRRRSGEYCLEKRKRAFCKDEGIPIQSTRRLGEPVHAKRLWDLNSILSTAL